ncbi:MAG: diversity-generating retroelement protein Avd [Desulfovibrionales bacterium]|nr:diversity-generating retroelement protein Avd [Desulfovibrionales bacterium]
MPQEVDAITKLYDFILWMIPKLEKYPRSQKFLLADRIENLMLDTLELLIDAAYSKKKGELLRSANLELEKLRYLVRLSKDLKLLNVKEYEFSSRSINEIGTSIGGWLKYTRRENLQ